MKRNLITALLLLALPLGAEPASEGREFGAGVSLEHPTPLAEVTNHPERHTASPVLVEGRITDLCMRKGCWTVITAGGAAMRVRFQDYGFFLPKDAMGVRAQVEGVAEVRTLSEREARHYAAESREGNPDAIEGPQREVGFVATGVRLLPGT